MLDTVDCILQESRFKSCYLPTLKNELMSRAHDVWNGAATGDTADMRGVDIPRLSAFNMVD